VPEPVLVAFVDLIVHEKHWSISSKNHNELPKEHKREEVKWDQSHVTIEDNFEGTAHRSFIIMHLIQ